MPQPCHCYRARSGGLLQPLSSCLCDSLETHFCPFHPKKLTPWVSTLSQGEGGQISFSSLSGKTSKYGFLIPELLVVLSRRHHLATKKGIFVILNNKTFVKHKSSILTVPVKQLKSPLSFQPNILAHYIRLREVLTQKCHKWIHWKPRLQTMAEV